MTSSTFFRHALAGMLLVAAIAGAPTGAGAQDSSRTSRVTLAPVAAHSRASARVTPDWLRDAWDSPEGRTVIVMGASLGMVTGIAWYLGRGHPSRIDGEADYARIALAGAGGAVAGGSVGAVLFAVSSRVTRRW